MNPVNELELRFLSKLEELVQRLAKLYPQYKFNTYSSSTGSATAYQGHDLGAECVFPNASPERANCVTLIIGVTHLTTTPLLCEAGVAFGQGNSPEIKADLLVEPVPFSPKAIDDIESGFSELAGAFERAVQSWAGWV